MAFSSDDSTCAPTSTPTPNEFSRLMGDEDALFDLKRKFAQRPTHAAVLRSYEFITMTMNSLEEELERQTAERKALYDYLFGQQKFRTRVRPIVEQYRHKLARIRRGFHPYHRPTAISNESSTSSSASSSTSSSSKKSRAPPRPITPSLVEQGPTSPIPATAMPAPFREETEEPIEDITPPDDRLPSYDTAIDEPLGSSRRPIEVNSDDDQICHGCRGNHNWKRCDRLYKYNKEADDYLPIPDIPPTKLSDIVPGITRIDFDAPFPSSSSTPCRRCLETGHVEEDFTYSSSWPI